MITVGVVRRSLKRDVQREDEKKASHEKPQPGMPTTHGASNYREKGKSRLSPILCPLFSVPYSPYFSFSYNYSNHNYSTQGGFRKLMNSFKKISDHLYSFRDTSNVYVIKDGERALLVDAGSGAVQDQLQEIGCRRIEWVLHTHHHRDQCWGDRKLVDAGAQVAVPRYEKHLFEKAELFWQSRRTFDNYDDRNTFFTIGENIPVAATLDDYEEFKWGDYRFFVLPAKGHTTGSVALLVEIDGRRIAFTGDLISQGGRLYQLHAMEYTYGDMVGVLFTMQSIQALRDALIGEVLANRTLTPSTTPLILPSHGEPIEDALGDIDRLERKLMELVSLGRGLSVGGRDSVPEPLYLPEPRFVPLSQHLLWGGPWTCSFFYVVLSDSDKAMFIDYGHSFRPHMHVLADHNGLEVMRFVEHHLKQLRNDYGIESFDLVVPTHIHDDHTCGIPHLQRFYGSKCYALDQVAQVLANPAAWASTPCTFHEPIRIDRTLGDGEQFQWEEYTFDIHFAPGQTEFHSVVSAEIDGRKVAFTGDNYFLQEVLVGGRTEQRPFQTTVLRNSFQLAMHRRCINVMTQISPQLICPGHYGVWDCDERLLREYADFIRRKEKIFRKLVTEPADHYIDLFWARMLPYVAEVRPGEQMEYTLLLRNNLGRRANYETRLLPADGWKVDDGLASLTLEAEARGELKLTAKAPSAADPVRRLISAEIRIEGVSQGPVAEALVTVRGYPG